MHHGKQILIGIDQFFNTLVCGWADETLSSRCWRWSASGKRDWPRKCVDSLFFWDKDHCRESFESERLRLQCPPELRG